MSGNDPQEPTAHADGPDLSKDPTGGDRDPGGPEVIAGAVAPIEAPGEQPLVVTPAEQLELRVRPRVHRTRRQTGPRRTALFALAALVVAAVAVVFLGQGVHRLRQARTGSDVVVAQKAEYDFRMPNSATGALVMVDSVGSLAGVLVMGALPGGNGGTAIMIPAGAQVSLPGGGSARLSSTLDPQGDTQQLIGALGLLLRIGIDTVDVVDRKALVEMVRPYTPLTFRIEYSFDVPDAKGQNMAFRPGTAKLNADQVAALLVGHDRGETDSDTTPRRLDLWQSMLKVGRAAAPATTTPPAATVATTPAGTSGGPSPTAPPTTAPRPTATQLFGLLAAGQSSVLSPDMTRVGGAAGAEMFALDDAQLRLVVAQAVPGRVSPLTAGPRIRLINTLGDQSVALEAIRMLTEDGKAEVVLVNDSADPPPAHTVVRYPSSAPSTAPNANEAGATALRDSTFPEGTVEQGGERVAGIELTVVLGVDIRDKIKDRLLGRTTTTVAAAAQTPPNIAGRTTTTSAPEASPTTRRTSP